MDDAAGLTVLTGRERVTAPSRSWAWLGLVPFLVFTASFLLAPAGFLFIRSLDDGAGGLTLGNYANLFQSLVLDSYSLSIRVSLASAAVGGVLGFLLAWAMVQGGLPKFIRSILTTFSGVASNFAGVPLAAAFIATLGQIGLVTQVFENSLGIDLYGGGFSLYTFWGLTFTYVYFQLPLMVLVIAPSIEGLKPEWREASDNLGGSVWNYWRHIAFPVLLPSLLGTMVLLFGNAFGAYATAYALTGGVLPLATIQIGAQISGDVLNDPGLGYAMAMGMVVIMALSLAGYTLLRRRAARWMA